MTQRSGGRDIVWHDGGTGGFFSFIGLDEARDTAIVVLGNSSKEGLDDIGFHILNSDLPLTPPPKQRKEITLAPGVLGRYAGVYDLEGMIVRVTCSAEGLSTHIEGQGTERLYAESETEFFYNAVDAQVVFDVDARGRVTGGVLHQEGETVPIKKAG